MPHPKVKIADNSGNEVSVTANRLDVNAAITIASDDINIGNVVLTDTDGTDIRVRSANSDSSPDLDGHILLGTHSLLSARKDDSTTIGITALDGNHNALHVAISDGTETANVNSSNQLEVNPSSGTTIASYAQDTIGTSAVALNAGNPATLTDCKEIIIQCDFDNTGYVMVGDSGLVADTEGIRLEAGDTLTLAVTTTANVYLRGSASDQKVNTMTIR